MVSLSLFSSACGGDAADPDDSDSFGASYAALCAGAPERHGDLVTTVACPFEQQVRNINLYGDELPARELFDADGHDLGFVTNECDTFWLGKDGEGVSIIVDSGSGRVLSHGMIHPSQATSLLPAQLEMPLTLQ